MATKATSDDASLISMALRAKAKSDRELAQGVDLNPQEEHLALILRDQANRLEELAGLLDAGELQIDAEA